MDKEFKVLINGSEKVVEFNKIYSRRIDREYNGVLFQDDEATTDAEGRVNFKIKPANMQKANDFLIENMTNLTKDELDELAVSDYDEILKIVNKKKTPSK